MYDIITMYIGELLTFEKSRFLPCETLRSSMLMEKHDIESREYYTVDVLHIIKTLWRRVWLIILAALIGGAVAFGVSSFGIAPTYSSSIKLYVNNTSISLGNTSFTISSSQLVAAQQLVKTYREILNSRTTLERIIEKAEVNYTYKQLSGMIVCAPSNETEIMKVTVTTKNPYEASKIANTIAEVLPIRISEIIDGASMEVVDSAIPELQKVAPSITRYTAIGLLLGAFIAIVVLVIAALMDDTIHDEDYILNTYEYPILGKVPNLLGNGGKNYGYYYQKRKSAEGGSRK